MATIEQCVPPLANGDFLTRDEFIRRWEEQPDIKFAELIGGVVYMPSPLAFDHGSMDADFGTWLGHYRVYTQGTAGARNATTYLLKDAPQPDSTLLVLPEYGGRTQWEGKYIGGTPDFFGEICATSAAYDLHQKLDLYEKAGIPEYFAVLVYEQQIRWHILVDGAYQLMPPDADGIWRSRVFPGLWLDGKALLAGNMQEVLAVLDKGLATPAHQAFVDKLQAAHKK